MGPISGDTFDHRTKIVHRESALNIVIMCEYFQGDIMPFWPMIIPALSKLGAHVLSPMYNNAYQHAYKLCMCCPRTPIYSLQMSRVLEVCTPL